MSAPGYAKKGLWEKENRLGLKKPGQVKTKKAIA